MANVIALLSLASLMGLMVTDLGRYSSNQSLTFVLLSHSVVKTRALNLTAGMSYSFALTLLWYRQGNE